ncbi:hypothetical protein ScPMuIL_006356 [Solemya velum]
METTTCASWIVFLLSVFRASCSDSFCNTNICQAIHQDLRHANSRRQACAQFYKYLECMNRSLRSCPSQLETVILTLRRTHASLVTDCNVQMPTMDDLREGDLVTDAPQREQSDDWKREDIDEQFDSFKAGTSKPGSGRGFHADTRAETSTVDNQAKDNNAAIKSNAAFIGGKENSTSSCPGGQCPVAENTAVVPPMSRPSTSSNNTGTASAQKTEDHADDHSSGALQLSKLMPIVCSFSIVYLLNVAFGF